MTHTITLIPGEGIGPEITAAVKKILSAAGVEILWDEMPPREAVESQGVEYLKCGVIDSIRKNHVALKGPMTTAVGGGARSINAADSAVPWPSCTPNAAAVALALLITPSAQTEAPAHMSQL